MIIRTRRRIKQGDYLRELQKDYGSLARLKARAAKDPFKRPLVEEWKRLAARPEQADVMMTITHEIIFHDFEEFVKVISPQRLRLLDYLRANPDVDSVNQLAQALQRNYRNVYDDVKRLASVGAMRLEPRTNRLVPKVTSDVIEVSI